MGFKSDFFKLLDKYKTLPDLDEELGIEKNGRHYKIVLEIEDETRRYNPPTHKDTESLIQHMVPKTAAVWNHADDPHNIPPLIQFCDIQDPNTENPELCSISVFGAKMFGRAILKEVEKRRAAKAVTVLNKSL